jgi:hypothetical protein
MSENRIIQSVANKYGPRGDWVFTHMQKTFYQDYQNTRLELSQMFEDAVFDIKTEELQVTVLKELLTDEKVDQDLINKILTLSSKINVIDQEKLDRLHRLIDDVNSVSEFFPGHLRAFYQINIQVLIERAHETAMKRFDKVAYRASLSGDSDD